MLVHNKVVHFIYRHQSFYYNPCSQLIWPWLSFSKKKKGNQTVLGELSCILNSWVLIFLVTLRLYVPVGLWRKSDSSSNNNPCNVFVTKLATWKILVRCICISLFLMRYLARFSVTHFWLIPYFHSLWHSLASFLFLFIYLFLLFRATPSVYGRS